MYGITAILIVIIIILVIMIGEVVFAILTHFPSTQRVGRVGYSIFNTPYKVVKSFDDFVRNRASL